MLPCPQRFMPNAAWRRFLAAHPGWRAPIAAPCTLATAARVLIGGVAIGAAGYAVPAAWRWVSGTLPAVWVGGAIAPPFAPGVPVHVTPVPESSAFAVLLVPLAALAAIWRGRS